MRELDIKLDGGKYTVIFDNDSDGVTEECDFFAERYGDYWRDLTGDGLVLSMAYEIYRLRKIEETAKVALTTTNIFDKMNKFTELKTMLGV